MSDNGSSCTSGDAAVQLHDQGVGHVSGARNHPRTQGTIERRRQARKNRVLLENALTARRL